MPNFSDFRRLVLTPGKAEIDQLAAFTMDWSEKRGARGKITHVTLTFTPKDDDATDAAADRSEEHTSELQSLMRNSYAVFTLKKKNKHKITQLQQTTLNHTNN